MQVDSGRIQVLCDGPIRAGGSYVLLWVQQDVRAEDNHALEVAVSEANRLGLPILACYGLYEKFPDATERAFKFLLEGLRDAEASFAERGVRLVCRRAPPVDVAVGLAAAAACVVVDCGYARICRAWRRDLVARLGGLRVLQVETGVVVPVRLASGAREPAAATLRPKIHRLLRRFLALVPEVPLRCRAPDLHVPGLEGGAVDLRDPARLLAALEIDRAVPAAPGFTGGSRQAASRLEAFLPKLRSYGTGKANDPSKQENSFLSPYLHFGHVSPVRLALKVEEVSRSSGAGAVGGGCAAFLEELIVRRELARNFCLYCDEYDAFACLPDWAQATLMRHASDARAKTYTYAQLERGETDDPCWNAAQWEMVATGHMHNYMRMYWCKQLITWTADPRTALSWAIALNNRYSLDGRDENGYMGIAWCFGHHDRPFPERPVFGTVRPMTRSGIEGKFNMPRYRQLVQRKCRDASVAEPRLLALLPRGALGGSDGSGSLIRCFARLPPPDRAGPGSAEEALADAAPERLALPADEKTPSRPSKRVQCDTPGPAAPARPAGGLHKFFRSSAKKPEEQDQLPAASPPAEGRVLSVDLCGDD